MQTDTQIQAIEEKLNSLMAENPTHFLVDIKVKPTNNVKVFIDADEGIMLSTLISYNRSLTRFIEESGIYPTDNYSLEVSSPGLDEPLKKERQYKKNIGRYVEVLLTDAAATKKEGKIIEVAEDGFLMEWEEGKGKKKEVKQEKIMFTDIKSAKIQVKF